MKTTHSKYLTVEDCAYRINSKVSGVIQDAIKEMVNQLVVFTQYYSKSLFIRFDLHVAKYSETNAIVSQFLKAFKARLVSWFNVKQLCYVWCREIWKSDVQHYHFVIGVDGHKIKHSHRIIKLIEELWGESKGNFWIPNNCFYYLNKAKDGYHEMLSSLIFRASYLAKVRSKQLSNLKCKMYGRSRLKAKWPINVTFR